MSVYRQRKSQIAFRKSTECRVKKMFFENSTTQIKEKAYIEQIIMFFCIKYQVDAP